MIRSTGNFFAAKAKEVDTRRDVNRLAKKIGVPAKTILKWRRNGNFSDSDLAQQIRKMPLKQKEEWIVVSRKLTL